MAREGEDNEVAEEIFWEEMDKMLLCTKIPKCVKNYSKIIKQENTVEKVIK